MGEFAKLMDLVAFIVIVGGGLSWCVLMVRDAGVLDDDV